MLANVQTIKYEHEHCSRANITQSESYIATANVTMNQWFLVFFKGDLVICRVYISTYTEKVKLAIKQDNVASNNQLQYFINSVYSRVPLSISTIFWTKFRSE